MGSRNRPRTSAGKQVSDFARTHAERAADALFVNSLRAWLGLDPIQLPGPKPKTRDTVRVDETKRFDCLIHYEARGMVAKRGSGT